MATGVWVLLEEGDGLCSCPWEGEGHDQAETLNLWMYMPSYAHACMRACTSKPVCCGHSCSYAVHRRVLTRPAAADSALTCSVQHVCCGHCQAAGPHGGAVRWAHHRAGRRGWHLLHEPRQAPHAGESCAVSCACLRLRCGWAGRQGGRGCAHGNIWLFEEKAQGTELHGLMAGGEAWGMVGGGCSCRQARQQDLADAAGYHMCDM